MNSTRRKEATRKRRVRSVQRGFKRFEVMAREEDREVIETFARQLAANGQHAERLRAAAWTLFNVMPHEEGHCGPASQDLTEGSAKAGESGAAIKPDGILAALRRSPMVGADLDLTRIREGCRRGIGP